MIEEPPLLTIRRDFARASADTCAAYARLPTSVISDAMDGRGAMAANIRLIAGGAADTRIAGPALTADCGPADLLALLASLAFAKPGDIAISAYGGHMGCANAGDRVAGFLKNAGAVGLITDGPVRDLDGIDDVGLPVWAAGVTPASPFSNGPGRVGLPVDIGGQRVDAGDMVIADRDGVVVVPQDRIDAVLARAQQIAGLEGALDAQVRDGLVVPPAIEDLLKGDRIRWVD